MHPDLFDALPVPQLQPFRLDDGAVLLRGFAGSDDRVLLKEVEKIIAVAPLRHMITPGGFRMSVAMSNCGQAGWVSDPGVTVMMRLIQKRVSHGRLCPQFSWNWRTVRPGVPAIKILFLMFVWSIATCQEQGCPCIRIRTNATRPRRLFPSLLVCLRYFCSVAHSVPFARGATRSCTVMLWYGAALPDTIFMGLPRLLKGIMRSQAASVLI